MAFMVLLLPVTFGYSFLRRGQREGDTDKTRRAATSKADGREDRINLTVNN